MVANELTFAPLTLVVLLTIAFYIVFLYTRIVTVRTHDIYFFFINLNILSCFSYHILPSSSAYFLKYQHLMSVYMADSCSCRYRRKSEPKRG